jgi:hypothetical protein
MVINKSKNKIQIIVDLGVSKYEVELNNRFVVWYKNRWDLVQKSIREYFIDYGKKGCYLDAESIYRENTTLPKMSERSQRFYLRNLSNIDVWDLSLIFPDVEFNDNTETLAQEIETVWKAEKITDIGVKIYDNEKRSIKSIQNV